MQATGLSAANIATHQHSLRYSCKDVLVVLTTKVQLNDGDVLAETLPALLTVSTAPESGRELWGVLDHGAIGCLPQGQAAEGREPSQTAHAFLWVLIVVVRLHVVYIVQLLKRFL